MHQNLSRVFLVLVVAKTGSCVGPQNEEGHPAHCYRQLMQVPVLSVPRNINRLQNMWYVFLGLHAEVVGIM